MPRRTKQLFKRFTIRVRSPTRLSRSRVGRLPSSSSSVGMAAMLQWSVSPRSQPMKARFKSSVSSRSVLARRCSRDTETLVGWMTYASMECIRSQRASQNPSRPASKATQMRLMGSRASSHQSVDTTAAAGWPERGHSGVTLRRPSHPPELPCHVPKLLDIKAMGLCYRYIRNMLGYRAQEIFKIYIFKRHVVTVVDPKKATFNSKAGESDAKIALNDFD